jgi:hypothetical protein
MARAARLPGHARSISTETVTGQKEQPMDFRDRRIWYTVAAVIIMVIIVYAAGWFSTHPAPAPPQ